MTISFLWAVFAAEGRPVVLVRAGTRARVIHLVPGGCVSSQTAIKPVSPRRHIREKGHKCLFFTRSGRWHWSSMDDRPRVAVPKTQTRTTCRPGRVRQAGRQSGANGISALARERHRKRASLARTASLFAPPRSLPTGAISAVGGNLSLDSNLVSSDVADFDRAIRGGDREAAAQLYRGPFLQGFHLADATRIRGLEIG